MELICEQKALQRVISLAERAANSKSNIQALGFLMLEADGGTLTVTGYDLKISVRSSIACEVLDSGKTLAEAKILSDVVKKLPDGEVKIKLKDKKLTLSGGKAKTALPVLSVDQFPELPDMADAKKSFRISAETLGSLFDQTAFAVSHDETRIAQTGVKLSAEKNLVNVAASDGFRLSTSKAEIEEELSEAVSLIVPEYAVKELNVVFGGKGAKSVDVYVSERHALFHVDGATLMTRLLDGIFLDVEKTINGMVGPTSVAVNRLEAIESLDRVSVVVNQSVKSPVRCEFGEDILQFSANTSLGTAKDVCKTDGDGHGTEIGINARYLSDALRHSTADELELHFFDGANDKPITVVPADGSQSFVHLVLPVRLKAE